MAMAKALIWSPRLPWSQLRGKPPPSAALRDVIKV